MSYMRLAEHTQVAKALAELADCPRRQVGAVLTDINWNILAVGHNRPKGDCGIYCEDGCTAQHAEAMAINNLNETGASDLRNTLVTVSPCVQCVKRLLQTNCKNIYFLEKYRDHDEAKALWLSEGNKWRPLDGSD